MKPQHSPHKHVVSQYDQQQQFTPPPDSSPLLPTDEIKYIKRRVGSFRYYRRAVDPTILPEINELGLSQAKPTVNTYNKLQQLFDYLFTHPASTISYTASDMVQHVYTDAAYLIAPGAKSRIAGYYYMGNKYNNSSSSITPLSTINGAIHVDCKILEHMVSSAAEAETAGIFSN